MTAGRGPDIPFVTLTFASSLDSSLALAPGKRTVLSGPLSKALTHHLRARHDAILIGVGTAVADDPGLNCRLALPTQQQPAAVRPHHPRPIIVDPTGRWRHTADSKVFALARQGKGLAPWILVGSLADVDDDARENVRAVGGRYIVIEGLNDNGDQDDEESDEDDDCPVVGRSTAMTRAIRRRRQLDWTPLLRALRAEGVASVMVEGGGEVINSLLERRNHGLVSSVVVTLAPTWLGRRGVVVSPVRSEADRAEARLRDVSWIPLGEDVVLCGRL